MTELELRRKVVDVAKSYIGAKESDGSHKPIIDLYNQIVPLPRGYKMKYTDPWCAAFVSVISYLCGLLSYMPAECGCDPMINLYKKMGRWEENDAYNAEIGDVVFYDWQDSGVGDDVGSADHVGIIVDNSGSHFTVVEGNMSDAVGIRKLLKNGKNIRGFGLPGYFAASDENPEIPVIDNSDNSVSNAAATPTDILVYDIDVKLPELSYGCGLNNPNPVVEAAQLLLVGRNYSCGGAGTDGEFGNGTLAGVKNYQIEHGLEADGIIGLNTWMSLLGLK